jgi:hypothetical protein
MPVCMKGSKVRFGQLRTCRRIGCEQLCAKTGCEQSQQTALLFDHLVGERKHLVGDFETERLSGVDVDHQLEL